MDRSKVRRAVCTVWRRLLEAALIPSSGQSVSISCSRWRRFPVAKARSLTRLAAFLRRQAPSSMVRAPTLTSKPPSTLMRMASSLSEVPLASPRILVFGRRSVTFAAPAKDNDNKVGNSAIPCFEDPALHVVQRHQYQPVSIVLGQQRTERKLALLRTLQPILCSQLVDRDESRNTNRVLRFQAM